MMSMHKIPGQIAATVLVLSGGHECKQLVDDQWRPLWAGDVAFNLSDIKLGMASKQRALVGLFTRKVSQGYR